MTPAHASFGDPPGASPVDGDRPAAHAPAGQGRDGADGDGHRQGHRQRYWRLTLRLTIAVLAAWWLVTLLAGLWLPATEWTLLGWPLGYWAASQGALYLFCALVALYAWEMDRLESPHRARPWNGSDDD